MPDTTPEPTRRAFLRSTGTTLLAAAAAGASLGAMPLEPPDKQAPNLPLPGPAPKKLGWAIVGLGSLALGEVLPAFGQCQHARPTALVSGHPEKARKVADHYGINPKSICTYENYDRIRDNPEVDIIYIILPNSMHAEYTIRGLQAGKHVLCEKPMSNSSRDCQQMIDAAKSADRKLMVAYRLRYEPFNRRMIEIARSNQFGPIKLFESVNVQTQSAPNIRLSRSLGGGSVWDVGIYCLNAARYILGEEPVEVSAFRFSTPTDERFREVDESATFQLRFPSGALANCMSSFGVHEARRYRAYCPEGWFGLEPAFNYQGLRAFVGTKDRREDLDLKDVNHFAAEMDHLCECVMQNKQPLTPGEEGLADIRVIEKIYQAAEAGGPLKV
jgi:predicted dehydrogenase